MALSCRTTRILHTLVTWSVILAVLPSNQLPNMDPYVGNVALIYTMGAFLSAFFSRLAQLVHAERSEQFNPYRSDFGHVHKVYQ